VAKSQYSFKTAVELSKALRDKQVSAVELAEDAIGRIERHDGKVNAICVRDFERPRCGPRRRRGHCARRAQAAARHSHDGEGILQRRRIADHLGLPAAKGFRAG
jgi:Asp-tRNA(Asn)/Glu-tRNA(Gln) amidotransferase A subunit family amidase